MNKVQPDPPAETPKNPKSPDRTTGQGPGSTTDLVCGMNVTAQSGHSVMLGERRYVFCSAGCREKFLAQPGEYVDSHGNAFVSALPTLSPSDAGTNSPKPAA